MAGLRQRLPTPFDSGPRKRGIHHRGAPAANPTPLGGYAEHDDLQAFERDHRKINGDAAFLQMLGGASDCFPATVP
jgi:hypothetical protein